MLLSAWGTNAFAAICNSTGGGTWNAIARWSCGHVPLAVDDVFVLNGHTITIDIAAVAQNVTVNTGGILRFATGTARSLTVSNAGAQGNITVQTGATLDVDPASNVTHTLTAVGNIVNAGTFNLAPDANSLCDTTFSRNGNQTVSGAGATTRFNLINVNMGATEANILDVTATNFAMAAAGYLTITNGTFRLSTNVTIAPFDADPALPNGSVGESIPSNGRFWLNSAGAIVNVSVGAASDYNLTFDGGTLQMTSGTLNIGDASDTRLRFTNTAGSAFTMDGGALNISGRWTSVNATDSVIYNQSAGTVTVGTVGNSLATFGPFFLGSGASSSFTMSGGSVVIVRASTAAADEYDNRAPTSNVTGGTVQIGNASTPAGQTHGINSVPPIWDLTVNTTNSPTAQLTTALTVRDDVMIGTGATLNANNLNIGVGNGNASGNWTNNGNFTAGTGTVTFTGTGATATIGGTSATTFNNFTINKASNNLAIATTPTISGVLTFTSGDIVTGANRVILGTAATVATPSAASYVFGTVQKNYSAAGTLTFPVGDANNYTPVVIQGTAGFTAGNLAINTTGTDHPQVTTPIASTGIDANRSVNRYWTLTATGLPAASTYNATFNFITGSPVDLDSGVTTANFIVQRYDGTVWNATTLGTAGASSTLISGLANVYGDFAIGEPNSLNHYRVQNNATGVNCQAENVTITAHNSAHAATAATGRTITVTAARVAGAAGNHGDWSLVTGTGTLTNGTADDGVATYAFASGESSIVLALRDTLVQTVNIAVTDGTATDTSGTANADAGYNQDLAFVNSGFRITDGSGAPAPISIATQVAGTTSITYGLQAIRTDTNTGACVAAFASGSDVTVDLASQCNNPISCIAGQNVTITNNAVSATIASNPNAAVSTYTSRSLRFGANSQALFTLNYPDVGQISLHARYNIPLGTGAPSGNFMTGSSNQFVVKPAGFTLSNIQQTAAPNLANPAAADATGARFVKAGEAFSVTVTARNSAGNATPNYGRETTPETVRLTSNLVAGLGLTNNPTLGNPTAFGAFSAGVATGTTFNWGDVGIITLTPTVGDADYLGVGNVTGTTTGNVGRFFPDHFAVTRNSPTFNPACTAGNFTYVGQPFAYATAPVLTVTARNASGNPTLNYSGTSPASQAWWKITNGSLTGKTYAAASGTVDVSGLPVTDPVIVSTGNGAGTLTFGSGTGLLFSRSTPVVPFDADISLAINVVDSDTTVVANVDGVAGVNPVRFGTASAGNGIAFVGGAAAKQMRFGRMRLDNAYGSTLLDLPLPLTIEYYNSSGVFLLNAGDSCTTLQGSDMSFAYVAGTPNLTACETAINPATTIYFVGGRASTTAPPTLTPARLIRPGNGNDGAVDLAINLNAIAGNRCTTVGAAGPAATNANKPWLQGNWGALTYDRNPQGRAAFGVFKSADQFLYLREVY